MPLSSSSQGPPQSLKTKRDSFQASKNPTPRSLLSTSEDPLDLKNGDQKCGDCASPTTDREAVGCKMQNFNDCGLAGTPGPDSTSGVGHWVIGA
eukprot:10280188-Karenia_brevis.AAC.1